MSRRVTRSSGKAGKAAVSARGLESSSTDSDANARGKGQRKQRKGTFTHIEEEVHEELLCSICMEPFTAPVEHRECGNVFCGDCVQGSTLASCPLCRGACEGAWVAVRNRVLLNMLASLAVHCDDCGAVMARYQRHPLRDRGYGVLCV